MKYYEFLEIAIDRGIEAVKRDYVDRSERSKMLGSLAGFNACRGRHEEALELVLYVARAATEKRREQHNSGKCSADDYWYARCYELEVEWICNVVSALFAVGCHSGRHTPIVPVTARAALFVSEILGGQ